MKWKAIGRDGGKTVVQFDNGREERLSDEDFAALQGGSAVRDLNDRKRAEAAEKALAEANASTSVLETDLAKAISEAAAATKAAKEWQERCEAAEIELEKAKATILELEAANKALEQAAGGESATSTTPKTERPARRSGAGK